MLNTMKFQTFIRIGYYKISIIVHSLYCWIIFLSGTLFIVSMQSGDETLGI